MSEKIRMPAPRLKRLVAYERLVMYLLDSDFIDGMRDFRNIFSSRASTCALPAHCFFETLPVDAESGLTSDLLCQFQWDSVCVPQCEGELTGEKPSLIQCISPF